MTALGMFAVFDSDGNLTRVVAKESARPSVRDITAELAMLLSGALQKEIKRLQEIEGAYEYAQSAAEDRRFC